MCLVAEGRRRGLEVEVVLPGEKQVTYLGEEFD